MKPLFRFFLKTLSLNHKVSYEAVMARIVRDHVLHWDVLDIAERMDLASSKSGEHRRTHFPPYTYDDKVRPFLSPLSCLLISYAFAEPPFSLSSIQ